MPTFAIDGSGEVFQPELVVNAKQTRTQASCQRECFGCGANMPPERLVAEVPDGAHVGAIRSVKVPLAVHVVFSYPKTARCMPKP